MNELRFEEREKDGGEREREIPTIIIIIFL